MSISAHFGVLFFALIADAIIGDPDWLWRRIAHPVVWIGNIIDGLDTRFNIGSDSATQQRRKGVLSLIFLVVISGAFGLLLHWTFNLHPSGWILETAVVAIFLSGRSLYDHVARVANAFVVSDLAQARIAVSKIVGRDPETLDRAAVCRAAIESLAENFSDGIIAPALWYLIGGLPGLLIYKAVNTADSMIGHKSERHVNFGWAAARLDDLINLPASRFTALLCLVGTAIYKGPVSAKRVIAVITKDAHKHRSPNAGWPEAAFAGSLDIALSGPRIYNGKKNNEPWVNEAGNQNISHSDISNSLRLYIIAMVELGCVIGILSLKF